MFSYLTIYYIVSLFYCIHQVEYTNIHQYSSVRCLEFLPQLRPDIFNQLIRIRYLDYSRRRKVIAGSLQEVSERLVGVVVVVGVLLWSVCGGMVVPIVFGLVVVISKDNFTSEPETIKSMPTQTTNKSLPDTHHIDIHKNPSFN